MIRDLRSLPRIGRGAYRRLAYITPYKVRYFQRVISRGFTARTILFHPELPSAYTPIYKLCHLLGCQITGDLSRRFDLAVVWEDVTWREPNPTMAQLSEHQPVLNLECRDISKSKVDAIHSSVFGYGLSVDPLSYRGVCLKKSNRNGLHQGTIIKCPADPRSIGHDRDDGDSIFQRVVNNQTEDGMVEDIRIPVFGSTLPFCYLKYRPLRERFSNENAYSTVAEVESVISKEELIRIRRFSREMRLDYGELDVLRDRDDGRVYVVDVNNTPYGPPNHLTKANEQWALRKLANAFEENFLSATYSPAPIA